MNIDTSSGHGSLLPAPVCSCDACPGRCACECYACAMRRLDGQMRSTLGWAYHPAKAIARAVAWVLR